jgi:hypothetical protein
MQNGTLLGRRQGRPTLRKVSSSLDQRLSPRSSTLPLQAIAKSSREVLQAFTSTGFKSAIRVGVD